MRFIKKSGRNAVNILQVRFPLDNHEFVWI